MENKNEPTIRTEEEQIDLLNKLKGSGQTFQNCDRTGFIHFYPQNWVGFVELHSNAREVKALPFDNCLDLLLDASASSFNGFVPKYEFEKIWVEPYSQMIGEVMQILNVIL